MRSAAAKHGYIEVVEVLLAAGADVNLGDKFQQTAIHRGTPLRSRACQGVWVAVDTGVDAVLLPVHDQWEQLADC